MTTFIVPGLDGITFTATYDTEESWLRIEGHNTDGQQVSGSGFSITPDPIEPITITPEPAIADGRDLLAAAQQHLDPPEEP